MARAELVFANVADRRIWEKDGEGAIPLVYTIALPGRALPVVVSRFWKAPQGYVKESFELVAPSGRIAYSSEPQVRRMTGQMDLTRIEDLVEDAVFEELGIYAASFKIDGETEGQVEFQLLLQAPTGLPKDIEDAVKKVDVLWVGEESNGRDLAVPVWFVYDNGRIYLMGHSMGGGGTYYLGATYKDIWAGLAPIAGLGGIPDAAAAEPFKSIPMLLLHGEKDSIIPPTVSRRSVLALQAVGAPHLYLEFPGKDHEFFIRRGAEHMEKVFLFFATVSKQTNVGFVTPEMAPPLPPGGRGRAGGPPPAR